nr:unnamed protein product [Spirometra erinaceieuropaei]
MLNHSPEYLTAAAASFIEYALEIWLWPAKSTSFAFVNLLGLSLCIFGEVLRKVAMFTAARNFSHVVQHVRDTEHQLVRHGVYGWFRHPAYVGWFYWSLGTQLLLLNPICSIFYPLAAYTFFKGRIDSEEASLIRFFGDAYRRYQRENFLALCASDYYKGCIFHRNIKGFIVQTGDPTGTGKNGQSIWKQKFKDEFNEALKHTARGVVSMANNGPDSNGSQFFITYSKQTMLDMKYSIFGKVIDGWDVLDELERAPVEDKTYRPLTDIHIQDVTIHANPFAE